METQQIDQTLYTQALRLSLKSQLYSHAISFDKGLKYTTFLNQVQDQSISLNNVSKQSDNDYQKKFMVDGQIMLIGTNPESSLKDKNMESSLLVPPEVTSVQIIENQFNTKSNYIKNQKYSIFQWNGVLELVIFEIIASNLIRSQALDLSVKDLIVQLQNSIILKSELDIFDKGNEEHITYEKLTFEVVNHDFIAMVQFLKQYEFFVITCQDSTGICCVQFIHFEKKLDEEFLSVIRRNISHIESIKSLVSQQLLKSISQDHDNSLYSRSNAGPEQPQRTQSESLMMDRNFLVNIDMDPYEPLNFAEIQKINQSQPSIERLSHSWDNVHNPRSEGSFKSNVRQKSKSLKEHSSFPQYERRSDSKSQILTQSLRSDFELNMALQSSALMSSYQNSANHQKSDYSIQNHNEIINPRSRNSANINQNTENFHELLKQSSHQQKLLARSLNVKIDELNSLRKQRTHQLMLPPIDDFRAVDLLKKKFDRADKQKKIQQSKMLELKQKVQEQKLFMNMVIHDLRSPSESIQQGLIQAKQIIEKEMNKILKEVERKFQRQILVNTRSISEDQKVKRESSFSKIQLSKKQDRNWSKNQENSRRSLLDDSEEGYESIASFKHNNKKEQINSSKQKKENFQFSPKREGEGSKLGSQKILKEKQCFWEMNIQSPGGGNQQEPKKSYFALNKQSQQQDLQDDSNSNDIQFNRKSGQRNIAIIDNENNFNSSIQANQDDDPNQQYSSIFELEQSHLSKSRSNMSQLADCIKSSNIDENDQQIPSSYQVDQQPAQPQILNKLIQLRDQKRERKIAEQSNSSQDSVSMSSHDEKNESRKQPVRRISEVVSLEQVNAQRKSSVSLGIEKVSDADRSIREVNERIHQLKNASLRVSSHQSQQERVEQQLHSNHGGSSFQQDDFDQIFDEIGSDEFVEHPVKNVEIAQDEQSGFDLQSNLRVNVPRNSNIKDNNYVMNKSEGQKKEVNFVIKYVDKKKESEDKQTQTDAQDPSDHSQLKAEGIDSQQMESFIKDFKNYKVIMDAMGLPVGQIVEDNQLDQVAKYLKQASQYLNINEGGMNSHRSSLFSHQLLEKQNFSENLEQEPDNNQKSFNLIQIARRPVMKFNSQRFKYEEKKSGESIQNHYDNNTQVDHTLCPRCLSISRFMLKQYQQICQTINTTVMYIEQSISSSYNLTNLINDLLDLAKLEQATFQLSDQQFNMFEVISELFTIMKYQASKANIKLLLEFDTSQPFVFQRLNGDKRRFLQIIQNFVSNSLKFTPSGGFVKIHLKIIEEQVIEKQFNVNSKAELVELKSSSDEQICRPKRVNSMNFYQNKQDLTHDTVDVLKCIKLKMVIEDNGAGISKENVNKLFQDYSRLQEHENMNAKGTGLGMSICKKIITQMGGNVYAESQVGQGTKINIELGVEGIDKKFLLSQDQDTMTNEEKILHLKLNRALNYFQEFWQVFEKEKVFKPDELTEEEINQYQNQKQTHYNALKLDQCKELFVFNPLAIRNKDSDQKNIYLQRISVILDRIQKFSTENDIDVISLRELLISPQISDRSRHYNKKPLNRAINENKSLKSQQQIKKSTKKMFDIDYSFKTEKKNQEEVKLSSFHKMNQTSLSESLDDSSQYVQNFQNGGMLQVNPNKNMDPLVARINKQHSQSNFSRGSSKSNLGSQASRIMEILLKYKVKKLRVLIANDDQFQLLILSSNLAGMKCIEKVDQATNGKEAVDLVKQNENNHNCKSLYYDLILLDLHMPICDGFEACQKIQKFYKDLEMERFLEKGASQESDINYSNNHDSSSSGNHRDQWLRDLKVVYQIYLDSLARNQILQDMLHGSYSQNNKSHSIISVNNQMNKQSTTLRLTFSKILKKVTLRALSLRKVPFIFAYTALVNEEVIAQTQEAGFDDCFMSPLQTNRIELIIKQILEKDCEEFIKDKFQVAFYDNAYHQMNNNIFEDLANIESSLSYAGEESLRSSLINKQSPGGQNLEGQILNYKRKQEDYQISQVIDEDQNEDLVSSFALKSQKSIATLRQSINQHHEVDWQFQSDYDQQSNRHRKQNFTIRKKIEPNIFQKQLEADEEEKVGSPQFQMSQKSDDY